MWIPYSTFGWQLLSKYILALEGTNEPVTMLVGEWFQKLILCVREDGKTFKKIFKKEPESLICFISALLHQPGSSFLNLNVSGQNVMWTCGIIFCFWGICNLLKNTSYNSPHLSRSEWDPLWSSCCLHTPCCNNLVVVVVVISSNNNNGHIQYSLL